MNHSLIYKSVISFILLFTALIFIAPNFIDKTTNRESDLNSSDSSNSSFLPSQKINLGLDLAGGSYLLLNIELEAYMDEKIEDILDSLKGLLRKRRIGYRNLSLSKNSIYFSLRSEKNYQYIKSIVKQVDNKLSIERSDDSAKTIRLFYNKDAIDEIRNQLIEQSIEIVRRRIDAIGTTEPNIQRKADAILVEVPGTHDPADLKRLLNKTAKLAFHMVDENALAKGVKHVPTGDIKLPMVGEDRFLLLKRKQILSGDHLIDAQVQFDQYDNRPVVYFSLNNLGAKKFADFTSKSIGKRLAIVLDGEVISAPVVNVPIVGGSGIIQGNFSIKSATDLALMLRSGALPAELTILEERSIGPSLGSDSIESGQLAAIIAFILVVVFMILVYGFLGIIASITLVITLLFILALLSILQATLTLPGIAAIVLTIGMAVDANVLIYEHIRDEIRSGCSNLYAIRSGFESALTTIIDSNLTTLIVAFLLYCFGTGSVQGFAVTLAIGIFVSMYTALVITKLLIDLWMIYINPKKLGL